MSGCNRGGQLEGETHFPYYLYVCSSRSITRSYSIHHPINILLHHLHEFNVVFFLRHITQMLNEIHDIRPIIHGVLVDHQPLQDT